MKRIVFSLLLLGITAGAWAQKPTKFKKEDVTTLLVQKKYTEAKDLIDKVLSNPKEQDNKEALTYKAVIYAKLATDSATKDANAGDLGVAATTLEQLQTATGTDTAAFNKLMRDDQGINAIASVYSNAFNAGLDEFKNSKWDDAYKSFYGAYHWADYITKNGFSQNPDRNAIDTNTVLYTGFAAQNASKYTAQGGFENQAMADSAMSMYKLLSDRNIATKDMPAMYQFMIQYYQAKKDKENTAKYLALAKQYYPDKNDLWSQIETENMLSGGNLSEIIKNYQAKDAAGGMTEMQYVEIAQTLANAEKTSQDSTEIAGAKAASIDAYKKAFNLSQNGVYAFNVGILNYQKFSELDDAYYANKGESADKKAKRDEIQAAQGPAADSALAWLEKSFDILSKKTEKEKTDLVSLNRSVDIIANLYSWKANKARGHNPADYDKFDALFKKYDGLHESFK